MKHAELCLRVKDCVQQDKLVEALQLLANFFQYDNNLHDQIMILIGQNTAINNQHRSGTISFDVFDRFQNKLRENILELLRISPPPRPNPFTIYRESIANTVVLQLLSQNDGISIGDLVHLSQFNVSGKKRLMRRLVSDALNQLQTDDLVIKTRERKAVEVEKRVTLFRLSAKGMQLLEEFENTIIFKKKEG